VPANYFLNALFSDVTLALNEIQIEGGTSMYPYKAIIESIFNFDDDATRTQLLPAGVTDADDERAKWVGNSATFELVGALRLDFLNQPKYLIPGVSVRISLTRSKDAFCLGFANGQNDDGSKFKVVISKCILYVRRVQVHPSVELGHRTGLIKKNAIYPYTRSKTITYTIPTGSYTYFKENLFSTAVLPKFVVVGMVHADACAGTLMKDPFVFEHFDVSSIALYRDGQCVPYKREYNLTFDNVKGDLVTDAYVRSILQNTQILNKNVSPSIDLADFKDTGYALYTFNLTPDFDLTQVQQVRDANLRLDLRFSKALPHPINVIVYGIFDSVIEITGQRRIIKDAH